ITVAAAIPDLLVSPSTLDFGAVPLQQQSDLSLVVSNAGNAELQVQFVASNNPDFSVVSPVGGFSVAAGGQQTVTVRFAPKTAADQSAILSIQSNDPDSGTTTVALSG